MQLSDEQLGQVKSELEKCEVLIPSILKKLEFDAQVQEVRKQLFEKYSKETILELIDNIRNKNKPEEEPEEVRIQRNLEMIEKRKEKLLARKKELENK